MVLKSALFTFFLIGFTTFCECVQHFSGGGHINPYAPQRYGNREFDPFHAKKYVEVGYFQPDEYDYPDYAEFEVDPLDVLGEWKNKPEKHSTTEPKQKAPAVSPLVALEYINNSAKDSPFAKELKALAELGRLRTRIEDMSSSSSIDSDSWFEAQKQRNYKPSVLKVYEQYGYPYKPYPTKLTTKSNQRKY